MTPPQRSLASLLGGSKELALFEAMAIRRDISLSAAEISRLSGVAWATTHRKLKAWEPLGVVVWSGREGKADKFALNMQSPAIRSLSQAVAAIAVEMLDTDLLHEGAPAESLGDCLPFFHVTGESLERVRWEESTTSTVTCQGVRMPQLPT
ncbi:MAG: hypothetical protein L3K13_04470 [Thermoplasmata archaeon]|nr:hypothetical protein [Thermoplasmata archaeon]